MSTEELLAERAVQWGDPIGTHIRIAEVWSGILGHHIEPVQVALMMTGLKLVRGSINPYAQDSFDDAHGYVAIAEKIVDNEVTVHAPQV